MAKDKQKKSFDLKLKLNQFTPADIVDGVEVPRVDKKTGKPIVIKNFEIKMSVLGKSVIFRLVPREETEKSLLLDFYDLAGVDELPVDLDENVFENTLTHEKVTSYDFVACIDKADKIHRIKMKCVDADRGKFRMAIEEVVRDYVLPEPYKKVRKARYDYIQGLKAAEEARKNGKSSDKSKKDTKSEELPF